MKLNYIPRILTDRLIYNANQNILEPLKRNIPFAQTLRLRRVCTADKKLHLNCNEFRKKLTEREYKEQEINQSIQRTQTFDRKELLKENVKNKTNGIPLILLTYNRTLPNVKKVIRNNCNLIQIYKEFQDIFQQIPILPYRRNKNLHDLLGCKNNVNNRVQKNSKNKIGFSTKYFSKSENPCCKQIVHSNSFTSNITKRTYSIFYNLDCKSKLVIYLMGCILCHIQYIGKSETQLNLRLNKHRKVVSRQKAPPLDQHFNLPGHNFNQNAKFILIEQPDDINIDNEKTSGF